MWSPQTIFDLVQVTAISVAFIWYISNKFDGVRKDRWANGIYDRIRVCEIPKHQISYVVYNMSDKCIDHEHTSSNTSTGSIHVYIYIYHTLHTSI